MIEKSVSLNSLHLWIFHFYNLFHVFVFCWNNPIYWLSNSQSFVCSICWLLLFCGFLFPYIFWLWAHVQWSYFLVHENPMSESTEQFCVGSREYLWMSKVLCYFPVILLVWVTGTKYGQWFKFHNLSMSLGFRFLKSDWFLNFICQSSEYRQDSSLYP